MKSFKAFLLAASTSSLDVLKKQLQKDKNTSVLFSKDLSLDKSQIYINIIGTVWRTLMLVQTLTGIISQIKMEET